MYYRNKHSHLQADIHTVYKGQQVSASKSLSRHVIPSNYNDNQSHRDRSRKVKNIDKVTKQPKKKLTRQHVEQINEWEPIAHMLSDKSEC